MAESRVKSSRDSITRALNRSGVDKDLSDIIRFHIDVIEKAAREEGAAGLGDKVVRLVQEHNTGGLP